MCLYSFPIVLSSNIQSSPADSFPTILLDNSCNGELCWDCSFCSWFTTNGIFLLVFLHAFEQPNLCLYWFCLIWFSNFLQVIESINRCDVDIRRELFSSILVNQYKFHFLIFFFSIFFSLKATLVYICSF